MTMRRAGTPLAAAVAVVMFGSGALAQQTLTLADLERMALEHNPTLSQSAADLEAVRGRAHQAGMVPNPIVGYTGEEISGGPIIRGGEHGFFVEQTIPLGGKLGRSRRVFELEAEEIEARREMQRQRVLTDVRALYYASLASDRRIAEWEGLAALTAEAVQVSRQLANVGAADRPDLLETEIEAARTGLSLSVARQTRDRIVRLLGAMVGDPTLHPQQLAGSIDDTLPELTHEEVLGRLLTDSPELTIARLAVARGGASVERAERSSAPDLIVRGGPRYNRELLDVSSQGARPVGWEAAVDVGLTVPIFNRNQGGVQAAGADLEWAQAELTRTELSLRARLAEVFASYASAVETARAYRSAILPRAEEAVALHETRFREMGAAYPQVLVARRTLYQARAEHVDALDSAWQAVVRLQGFLLTDGMSSPSRRSLGNAEP